MDEKIPSVLITGGSTGIGLELARLFARDGYRLCLVSLPAEELAIAQQTLTQEFPGLEVITLAKDLSVRGAATEVFQFTQEQNWPVDVLVNNAGFGSHGFIDDIDIDRELHMITLHTYTLYHLTRLYLREMIHRNRGHVVNLSSISAFQPTPTLATYAATKSFVLQFSRAINFELREQGVDVHVLTVCPTATRDTLFQKIANVEDTITYDNWMTVTPKIVARDAYRAMKAKKDLVIPGRGLGLLRSIFRHLPESLLIRFARYNLKPKRK